MRPVRVRELQSLGEPPRRRLGTARVALNLRGVSKDAVHRGMALVQAGRWTLTDRSTCGYAPAACSGASVVAARCRPASARPAPSPVAAAELPRTVTVHVGSARVVARVRALGPELVQAEPR